MLQLPEEREKELWAAYDQVTAIIPASELFLIGGESHDHQ